MNLDFLYSPVTLLFIFFGIAGSFLGYTLYRKRKALPDVEFYFFFAFGLVGTLELVLLMFGLGVGRVHPVQDELTLTFAYGLSGFLLGGFFGIIGSTLREWSIQKTETDTESMQEFVEKEKSILRVAKNYAGLLTKVILLDELGIPFDQSQKILARWVKNNVARKLHLGAFEVYDIPSARIHLTKIDQSIMKAIIDRHGRAARNELFSMLNVAMEALEEALKRLEQFGYIRYDSVSDEYDLRGIVR
jgi:hypothetical protein